MPVATSTRPRGLGGFGDLSNSVELLISARSQRIHYVYGSLLLVVAAFFIALPLVHVTVSVASAGMVRPDLEKQVLRARTSGFIRKVSVLNNQAVRANDTLLVLDDGQQSTKDRALRDQLAERQAMLGDFAALSSGSALSAEATPMHTALGGFEKLRFLAEQRRLQLTADEATRQREMTRTLGLKPGMVSLDEVRRRETEAAQAESELHLQRDRSVAEWSGRVRTERDNVREIQSQLSDLGRQRTLFTLLAPVSGTAEQVTSMSPGGFIQSGDELLQISPDTRTVAEMQVTARDVGMLTVGMPVRMMIDAFDYNSWGVATGHVISISHDATVIEHQAIYSVRCSIDQPALSLRNGYRGSIIKGMSLRARFLVARRSLFDLLYDHVDSWLNPSLASPTGA